MVTCKSKKKVGTQSYICVIHRNNQPIKRHLDQIRVLNTDGSVNASLADPDSNSELNTIEPATSTASIEDQNHGTGFEGTPRRQLRPRLGGK